MRNVKAVTTLPDGSEEIVGFAGWDTCVGRGGSEDEKGRLGTREGWAEEEKEKEGKKNGEEEDMFGLAGRAGNARFREDALIRGDEHMARSTEGRDYASELG
jgi:hypothetical protein